MSPANDFFKERPILGYVITLLIGLITVFTANALTKSDIDNREFKKEMDSKLDAKELEEYKKKAKEYVDNSFNNHEAKEQLIYNRIESVIRLSNEKQDAILKASNEKQDIILQTIKDANDITNRRLENIEDKIH